MRKLQAAEIIQLGHELLELDMYNHAMAVGDLVAKAHNSQAMEVRLKVEWEYDDQSTYTPYIDDVEVTTVEGFECRASDLPEWMYGEWLNDKGLILWESDDDPDTKVFKLGHPPTVSFKEVYVLDNMPSADSTDLVDVTVNNGPEVWEDWHPTDHP